MALWCLLHFIILCTASNPHLLLFEVTDSLNGQFPFDGCGGVTWFQLNDGASPLVKAIHVSLEFIQLFSLLLLTQKQTRLKPGDN